MRDDDFEKVDLGTAVIVGRVLATHYLLPDGRRAFAVQTTSGMSQIEAVGLLRMAEDHVLRGNTCPMDTDDQ